MGKVNLPAKPSSNMTIYNNFKGVDFSKDPYLVDKSHSPYAVNVISDKSGQPEKRPGWKELHKIEQPVNALVHGYIGGKECFIAHGGTKLYKWGSTGVEVIKSGINSAKSSIFFMQHGNKGKMFIFTGKEYLVYDGAITKNVYEEATVPVILIAGKPAGGGTFLQPINLLQPQKTEKRYGDGTAKIYQLLANNLDSKAVKITLVTATGQSELTEGKEFTVNRSTGQITFATAPPAPPVAGEDNVYITYAKTVQGYAERVTKCLATAYYGLGGSNRIFITRNPDYKSQDWWCEINDPTYFPDLNYAVIGNDNTAIMGYSKIGEYLVITKEDNQQDTTHFMRSASLLDNKAVFPIKPGITGTGAISPYSFVNLVDEPLFLSRTGVFAVTSNSITAERTLQNRSYNIDSKLLKEPNLENAVAAEWNGYYILAVNGNLYLLDSRQKSGARDSQFIYECYFWNNINATCFLKHNGELYFGTPTGQICKLKTEADGAALYNDNGLAITAIWSTNSDNDGLPGMYKTMQKKGSGIVPKPQSRSTIKVFVETQESDVQRHIKTIYADIFDFEKLDFERLSFYSTVNASFIPFRKKIKKYVTLRFWVVADELNESFGLFNIVKKWTTENDVKR